MPTRQDSPFSVPFPLLGAAILAVVAVFGPAGVSRALGEQNADEVKRRILGQAQDASPDDYAFTRTVQTHSVYGGKSGRRITVERFDPTRPAEERWTLVSVDGAPPAEDASKRFRADSAKRRVPGYHRLAGYFGTAAKVSTDPRGRTVFHFGPLPKGTVVVMDSDVSDDAAADATVSDANGTPFVEEVRVTVKPTRIKLVAKIQKYESTARYRMGPDGKPLLVEQATDMAASGMGQEGTVRTVATYEDYRAAHNPR